MAMVYTVKMEVYWGIFDKDLSLNMGLESLLKDISFSQNKYTENNYLSCPAIREKHKNTFFTRIPCDIDFFYKDNEYHTNIPERIALRQGLYENSHSFDLFFNRIFYSEVPQIMEVSPAFLHNTTYSKYGHAPSGSFDIGQWFRPSIPNFQLWSNENSFYAKQNEPHMYFNFPNSNKIVLRQFYVTDKLFEIAQENVMYKHIKPKQNLNSLYKIFNKSLNKKTIAKEIKNNLI
jgi:hypothetical protein